MEIPINPADIHPTKYWARLENGQLQCEVCPRACCLSEGQRGLCFVRGRLNDQIVLTTYGRSSGFCIDPIEKKPLNHFLPGTSVLSFGTAGCNLACKFCQNWDISKSRQTDTLAESASPERLAQAAAELGCRSVAFTYNDPVIFLEYAVDVAKACHALDLRTVAVTAGYIKPEARAELFSQMDATNVDLKAFSNSFYKKLCGGSLDPVLDTLRYLKHETNVWFEITTLLIPGENDSEQELEALIQWITDNLGSDVPLHFSAFHPDYRMRDKDSTSLSTLLRARKKALAGGINYVFTGNIRDESSTSTYCSSCGAELIVRSGYDILRYSLNKQGNCPKCGSRCAGVFEATPGEWGNRRKVVSL